MATILVFAYGNLSRGDDALGPLLLEHIEGLSPAPDDLELMTDFQLQIEHALDLQNRALVLFLDASVHCSAAYQLSRLVPEQDKSYTTHAMSPASVLAVYEQVLQQSPPPCFLLSIQGYSFELGAGLSELAQQNLTAVSVFVEQLLNRPELDYWMACR